MAQRKSSQGDFYYTRVDIEKIFEDLFNKTIFVKNVNNVFLANELNLLILKWRKKNFIHLIKTFWIGK